MKTKVFEPISIPYFNKSFDVSRSCLRITRKNPLWHRNSSLFLSNSNKNSLFLDILPKIYIEKIFGYGIGSILHSVKSTL